MFDEKSHSLKMDKSIEAFIKELSSLRTGRANAAMLDLVKVDVYGHQMPMVAQSIILGGNVRVGLEDNLYLEKGILASNAQLVEKSSRIISDLGAKILI